MLTQRELGLLWTHVQREIDFCRESHALSELSQVLERIRHALQGISSRGCYAEGNVVRKPHRAIKARAVRNLQGWQKPAGAPVILKFPG